MEKPQDCWDMLQLACAWGRSRARSSTTTAARAGTVLSAIMADPRR